MKTFLLLIVMAYSAFISYLYFNKIPIDKYLNFIDKQDKQAQKVSDKVKKVEQKQEKQKLKQPKKEEKIVKKDINNTKKIPKDALVVTLPEVPKVEAKVPQVVTLGATPLINREKEVLSMDLPSMPIVKHEQDQNIDKNKTSETKSGEKTLSTIGLNKLGRVSAYLRGDFTDKKDVIKSLKDAGFTILSVEALDSEGDLEVVVFTCESLQQLAKKSPFIGSIRLLIDKKNKQITIQNPYYFARAYLKDEFKEDEVKKVLLKLDNSFKNLKDSTDKLKYTLLPKYQFMFGMPSYDDMITVASAKDSKTLIEKLKKHKNKIAFIQKIDEDTYLVGVNLSKKKAAFYTHTGEQNSLLLPYPLMIKGSDAYILDPKYYIALSYPMLKMSQFMKISDIPSAIENECEGLFR